MSSDRARQMVEAGLWLRMSGDLDGARRLFAQALQLDPNNERARSLLGDVAPAPAATVAALAALEPAPKTKNPFVREDPDKPSGKVSEQAPQPFTAASTLLTSPPQPALVEDPVHAWNAKSSPGMSLNPSAAGVGAVMDLVTSTHVSVPQELPEDSELEVATLMGGVKDLLELDDHSGALELLEKLLKIAPHDEDVRALKQKSEKTLETMFESKLGDLRHIPKVALKDDEIVWLNLDHRAGFILAQIDGTVSFDDIFAISGMSRLDTARILAQLLEQGVVV